MDKELRVLPIGSKVTVGPEGDELKGTIIAITFSPGMNVMYKVSYWTKGDHKEEYFEPWEIHGSEQERVTIGFR